MELFICMGAICILGLILLIVNCLNDFYYYDKYKKMAKLNYYIIKEYQKYTDKDFNLILNKFYNYLENEKKQKQKEFEKKIKKDFKKNIKNDIDYIY